MKLVRLCIEPLLRNLEKQARIHNWPVLRALRIHTENLYLSSIKMQEIYDLAEMSYAKHILYLVDACYGGLAIQSRTMKKELTPEYLKKLTMEKGRQVITAGGKNEEVIENPIWGHSAFTKNLLNGLGENLLADENETGVEIVYEVVLKGKLWW